MNECPDHVDQAEVLAELQRLRKKIEQLEVNQSGRKPAQGFRHIHLTGRRLFLSLLGFATAVFLALVILGAQSKPDALFIDPNGNVGINQPSPQRTLDVNGDAVVRGQLQAKGTIPGTSHPLAANSGVVIGSSDLYFTDTAHQYTGQGNQQGSAAIENDSKDYKSLMILGRSRNPDCGKKPCDRVVSMFDRVGIRTSEPRADLDVNGGIVANGLDVRGGITATSQITADNVWVKIHEAQLNSAADYLIRGIDGNAYRRFRIEVEGTIAQEGPIA